MDAQHRNRTYSRISAGDSGASSISQDTDIEQTGSTGVQRNHLESSASNWTQRTNLSGCQNNNQGEKVIRRYSSRYFEDTRSRTSIMQRRKKSRFIKKTGHCNVSHSNVQGKPKRFIADIFTTCVDLRWRWNLLLFSAAFIISWLLFGLIYWAISLAHGDFAENPEDRPEKICVNNVDHVAPFTSAFLFSLETQTTIGYGSRSVNEVCTSTIITVVIQSIFGCFIDAFMIGLIMAKISRMQYLHSRTTPEGEFIPLEQIDLYLDLKNDSDRLFLVTPQTICHPITQDSPLYCVSEESLKTDEFEIIVILEGMVEATGMTTQARASYVPDEILWGHRFHNVVSFSGDNGYRVDFKKFNQTDKVHNHPICSASYFDNISLHLPEGSITDSMNLRSPSADIRCIRRANSNASQARDSGYTNEEDDNANRPLDHSSSIIIICGGDADKKLPSNRWSSEEKRQLPRQKGFSMNSEDLNILAVENEKKPHGTARKSVEATKDVTKENNIKNTLIKSSSSPSTQYRCFEKLNEPSTAEVPIESEAEVMPLKPPSSPALLLSKSSMRDVSAM